MSAQHSSIYQGVGLTVRTMETMRNHSELFRAQCSQMIQDTDRACLRLQSEDAKRLDQRLRDIQFVQKELELRLEEILVGIQDLQDLQSRVAKALQASKELLSITILCLQERMKRVPSERRHDDVDRELMKEREIIEGVEAVLQRVSEQINEQIRLNRSAQYHLEHDLKEKFTARTIDQSCAEMTAHSFEQPQDTKIPPATMTGLLVTPEQWENISDVHMVQAEQQKTNSLSLHALVDSLLDQTAADMQKQLHATTTAFQLNIQDLRSAKIQMEDQLAKVLSELISQKRIQEDLQVAITDSERCSGLAKARLDLRRQRPGKEQCFDPAQAQLLSEVQRLFANNNKLREAVARSEDERRAMICCQLELQEGIEHKADSLYIDEVVCTQYRKSMTSRNF
ncbi:tektin-1-like [Cheilinus undulatus]|uniref:tektin-1-like n=1 Tax=Cheilinus undulatus TaxID=241271 RepID=UPI001BD66C7A|nr:tektin-1-like [Cheilinus undulatus]XP_041668290.1 tektin-1-like [Cheilinus undulatus]XP_041668298.1 tektin-1-like [Cheilinus undulatus]